MAPPTASIGGEGAIGSPAEGAAPPAAGPARAYKNPLLWVPSSYLTMGLIYVAVGTVANIMFKNMGMENDKAAFWSSILGFPYTFKFIWAPALELYKTKKFFVLLMQFAISLALVAVAFGLRLPGTSWIPPVLTLVAITAVLGATQDIGTDGVYVTTLPPGDQAKYLGFQSMCWNGGALLAKGPFVTVSGTLHDSTQSWGTAWMIIMLAMGALVFLAGLYHSKMLPPGAKAQDAPLPMTLRFLGKLLFTFNGSITRAEFWVGGILLGAVTLFLELVLRSFGTYAHLALLIILPSSVALQVKRWHDRGKAGLMVFINLIPVVGVIWPLIELGCLRGKDGPNPYGKPDPLPTFVETLETFFLKDGILRMVAFAFLYRFGYGLLDKMGPLFLIDERAKGGLGLSNQAIGNVYGTFGSGAFIVGSLLGGFIVSRLGLKKTLLLLCLCINVPNATFLYLSQAMPDSMTIITAVVIIEQLGWGVGAVGHMIYMMQQIAPGNYKTAHYTFATALMGACMMSTGAVSGYIQKAVGYQWFFVIVLLGAAPSLIATLLAPFHHPDVTKQPAKA